MTKTIGAQIAELKERRATLIQEAQPADWGDTPMAEQERITAQILTHDDIWKIEREISALRAKHGEAT